MKGRKVKQINNLTIRYTDTHQYAVWTPDGRCWEDRLTLEQAEDFCHRTTDFLAENASDEMYLFTLTCNCYEPMFRVDVDVKAKNLEAAFTKAKKRLARKYGVKNPDDIAITAVKGRDISNNTAATQRK